MRRRASRQVVLGIRRALPDGHGRRRQRRRHLDHRLRRRRRGRGDVRHRVLGVLRLGRAERIGVAAFAPAAPATSRCTTGVCGIGWTAAPGAPTRAAEPGSWQAAEGRGGARRSQRVDLAPRRRHGGRALGRGTPGRRFAWETPAAARERRAGTVDGRRDARNVATRAPGGGGRLEARPSKNGSSSAMVPSARGGACTATEHVGCVPPASPEWPAAARAA